MLLVFGRCRNPTCHSTPLVELLASTLSLLFAGGLVGGLAVRHPEVRLSNATLRLLVWTSVRVLGSGRVEPRSNGGCWAQGVCRGQSSNRGVNDRSGGDFGGGVCASGLGKGKAVGGLKKKGKKKKVEPKNGAAWTANRTTQQILVAYGAGDASKRASRGFFSWHSAHT